MSGNPLAPATTRTNLYAMPGKGSTDSHVGGVISVADAGQGPAGLVEHRCLVEVLGRQAGLAYRHPLLMKAVSNGATVDGVRAGELVHGLASEVLLGDFSGFGSGETTLHLTWATRRREPHIDGSVRLNSVRWVAEAGEDVRFHREMFC